MSDIQREAFERWCLDNKIELFTKNWRDDDLALISLGKIFSLLEKANRLRALERALDGLFDRREYLGCSVKVYLRRRTDEILRE